MLIALGLTSRSAVAATITGDPTADAGWTGGANSLAMGTYGSGAEQNSFNVYSTAFTLDASSPLAGLAGPGVTTWQVGDTIVGVGGFVVPTNAAAGGWASYQPTVIHTVNQLISNGNQRIVVKYGTATATFAPSTTSPQPGNGVVSMASGGVGGVLLGTFSIPSSSSGQFVVINDASAIQTGVATTAGIDGFEGRVMESWNAGTLIGFESFLDLTLLQSQFPAAAVGLGDKFDVDMQDGTGNFTNAIGTLPSSLLGPTSVPLPKSATAALVLLGMYGAVRVAKKKLQPSNA